jgi:hypothetical protein
MKRGTIASLLVIGTLASAFTAVALTAEASAATLQSPVQIYNETPQIEGNAELGVETPSPTPTPTPAATVSPVPNGIGVQEQGLSQREVSNRLPGQAAADQASSAQSAWEPGAASAKTDDSLFGLPAWLMWLIVLAMIIALIVSLVALFRRR